MVPAEDSRVVLKAERLCVGAQLYAYLELCAEVWEHGAALAAWRQAVARHPTSLRLWRRYLRISTRTFASFSGNLQRAAF